ncbi:MAG: diguanylate cyclase (GGDEF)-like protein [Kiritimatiellia bacterium]|jgi:diguanylate cyclase (GGDEF)-like protein
MAIQKSALMKKLIVTIFSLYFILAVIVSAVHILFEYNHIRNQIRSDLQSIYTSSADPLATAIWNFNSDQINNLVDGLLTLNIVSGVKVYKNVDELNVSKGDVLTDLAINFEGPIVYKSSGKNHPLGALKFYASQSFVFERIKVNVVFIVINAFIKTFFLSIIIFIVGRRMIGRPLEELSVSVSRLDFENMDHIENSKMILSEGLLSNRNELTDLIVAYNKTLDKLLSRTRQRDEARRKIEDKNFNLERLVNIKTLALQEKVDELNGLNERLAVLASTDPLTELLNRRYFFERADIELSRLKRNGKQAAVLIVDVDFFKKVNDQYGHPAGDQVLKVVANILKANVRQHDLVARFGGEEFAIFLADVEIQKSAILAERMREKIESAVIHYKKEKIMVTASFGLSMLASAAQDIHVVIDSADKMLYKAKANGRNRVEC